MTFILGLLFLMTMFGAAFWFMMPGSTDAVTKKVNLYTLIGFVFLSGTIYMIKGQPDYINPRLPAENSSIT